MPGARPPEDHVAVLQLKAEGRTDRAVSLATGVPVETIRTWRQRGAPGAIRRALAAGDVCAGCRDPIHDFRSLPVGTYAYLLAMYLGDGCVFRSGRSTYLRITLDTAYPGIIEECATAVERIRGRRPNVAPDYRGKNCVHVVSYWKSWPCLLPQHGPGRKHSRKIELVDWQREIVDAAPEAFLRGLIHTDGWRGVNRVRVKGKDYAYPRYQFSNRSDDIRRLFTDTCERLGIQWRQWTRYHVSVARRESVALMDSFIGPKC
jgi:hypothetical protein